MRRIDIETWPRREHFKLLCDWDYPHFNMCANVDLTSFYSFVKQRGISINVAIVYVLARAANAIAEFRYRIRDGEVVEHEIVHPATTILTKGDLFSFCPIKYTEDFPSFEARAMQQIAHVKEHPTVESDPVQDDMLYMTAIPWVSFTSFMHPLDMYPVDSIPRFAWGKFFEQGEQLKMPLNVQAHHALLDGVHMGRYYAEVQDCFDQPQVVLGGE
jgi:chloramphenicol O-acetyltransferase type A